MGKKLERKKGPNGPSRTAFSLFALTGHGNETLSVRGQDFVLGCHLWNTCGGFCYISTRVVHFRPNNLLFKISYFGTSGLPLALVPTCFLVCFKNSHRRWSCRRNNQMSSRLRVISNLIKQPDECIRTKYLLDPVSKLPTLSV